MTRKFGFTLAEVLITLAIIGIVAAMTIPTLITEYKEKQTISQLLKVYATLSHAFKMAEAEHGSLETWGLNHTYHSKTDENGNPVNDYSAMTIVANRIMPYLKVAKVCVDGEICDPICHLILDRFVHSIIPFFISIRPGRVEFA